MTVTPTPTTLDDVRARLGAALQASSTAIGGVGVSVEDYAAGQVAMTAELRARIAELEAQIPHEPPPPVDPPPLPTRTLTGSSIPYDVAGRKRVSVVRCYLKQLGGEWSSYSTLRKAASFDPDVIWVSWKDTDPADVSKLLAGQPDDVTVWGTYHHEPENDLSEGAEAKVYRDKWQQMGTAIRAAGAVPWLCLMRYTLTSSSGRDWRQWWPEGAVDGLGWDAYRKGDAGDLGAVENMIDPILDVAKTTGLPWAIGETGSTTDRYSAADTVAFAKRLREYGTDQGAAAMCWWDQDAFRLTDAIARVWLDGASA